MRLTKEMEDDWPASGRWIEENQRLFEFANTTLRIIGPDDWKKSSNPDFGKIHLATKGVGIGKDR